TNAAIDVLGGHDASRPSQECVSLLANHSSDLSQRAPFVRFAQTYAEYFEVVPACCREQFGSATQHNHADCGIRLIDQTVVSSALACSPQSASTHRQRPETRWS